ncbi:Rrf2 family transcriptional regulator [Oscillospiraceae bacterium MB08-C2-2]|nr:Rrf2 family transcriptional regulator [Oscillospiraceae bacterium MB08-C2-2]
MKISTKGRYGLRIMLELTLAYQKNLVTVRQIGRNQEISEKYIEQIISMLHKAGLVQSQRGAQGGYRLAAPPETISVGAILRATEGGLDPVKCTDAQKGWICERMGLCSTEQVWRDIKNAVEDVVDNIQLSSLIEDEAREEPFELGYLA